MIGNIKDVLALNTMDEMKDALSRFDAKCTEKLSRLETLLETNILSSDVTSLMLHMSEVESHRSLVVKLHSFATAFIQHGKSSAFLPEKTKGNTNNDREAFQRGVYGGFQAWSDRLEGYIDCIDSRVNLVKKVLGIDFEGSRGKQNKYV